MTDLKIYHNPRCTKSRQTLKLLQEQGHEPEIILYLKSPPSPKVLKDLLSKLGLSAEALIRKKETIYKELELKGKDDEDLIKAMAENPKLIERPIVVLGDKARLGRPPENVLSLF